MQFGVLGRLRIMDGADELAVVLTPRLRVLLAVLLWRVNQPVPIDELAEMVWDGAPPTGAAGAVRALVLRLRRVLGTRGAARIVACAPGYMIELPGDELDACLLETLSGNAGVAVRAGQWADAERSASAALGLWRGAPLADVSSQALRTLWVPHLEELRVQTLEWRIEAQLRQGRHAELVGELREATGQHPLREHFHAQLMVALSQAGRQAEALAAYRDVRRVLAGELGIEPGPELRDLHARILAGDDSLVTMPPAPDPPQPAPPQPAPIVPRQLPHAATNFTGRAVELAMLDEMLKQADDQQPVIGVIGGAPGVGKTALAVQWARQVAGRFPDGQLYVNLRGYDPDQPVSASDALAGFLRTLGVPGQEIPDELEDRARLYRSRLAGRRMLALLDSARDGEQVRPLLPGDPGCVAVATSRDALAGLVAVDGAKRLDLDVLPMGDAVALLGALIGLRASQEPAAVAELAGLCARLPLALRIAAELAAARPSVTLADLVAELTADRLAGLDGGEQRADVRAVFSWSFRQLPGDVAGAFMLAGLHPGYYLDVYALAALTGTTAGQARRVLGQLHRASLVHAAGPGRYGMHDLLRAYAREQAAARGAGEWCQRALTGLFDYYRAAAAAAMDILFPAEARRRPGIDPAAAAAVPDMPGEAQARAWLDTERANLVAAVVHCAGYGWPQHAADLARMLFRYLIRGSHLPEADTIYRHALHAARRSGDLAAEASALNGLGGIDMRRSDYHNAASHYRAALERYRQCQRRAGEAMILRNLGMIELQLHNLQSAASYYRQSIAAYDDVGDSLGAARAVVTLAEAETELGSYDQAYEHLQRALLVIREANDQLGEAEALERVGWLSLHRGELPAAAAAFKQVLAIHRRVDSPVGVASQLSSLGTVSLRAGEYAEAIGYFRQALALFQETGNAHGQIMTLRYLAEALQAAGQAAAARVELTAVLGLAAGTGNTYHQACAHRDLAESHRSCGQAEQARHHWQQAIILYSEIGAPEADQVRLSAQKAEQAEA